MGFFAPLKAGHIIELEISGDEFNRYRARVEEVYPDKLVISRPTMGNKNANLSNGTRVKVIHTDDSALFVFSTEIISQTREFPVQYTLGAPSDTRKIQRRQFFRVDAHLKTHLTKLDNNLAPIEYHVLSVTTLDISGGGIRFNCNEELKPGDLWEAVIYLSDFESVTAIGRIVRCRENSIRAKEAYTVGFQFTKIEEKERDKIIRYIFNRQRELRQKGLL